MYVNNKMLHYSINLSRLSKKINYEHETTKHRLII